MKRRLVEAAWRRTQGLLRRAHPARLVLLGYASYVVVGWLLLCLPWSQKVEGLSPLDHLFTATSAVSTTGLTTLSVSDNYTFLGQAVVVLLIQLGGLGYMTLGSFVVLAGGTALSQTRKGIMRTVFSLPDTFDLARFIKSVILFTLAIELAGAVALYVIFLGAGEPDALWSAVFHSVSSFCTAGFSLHNNSFEDYAGNAWLNLTVGALSYLGAIGFIVFLDLWNRLTGRSRAMTLTSRIILWTTLWLSVVGTLLLLVTEPSLRDLPMHERLMAAAFQAMTAMTTVGFNTVSIGAMSKASVLLLIVLMVIGSSPSGTGGGLKSTTFSAILGVMKSAARGQQEVRFWNRTVPLARVWTAVGSLGFYLLALLLGTYLLELTEASTFDQNFFEAASALGTVGLSMGITAGLTALGKLIIIALMFCGRLSPLTLGIVLFLWKPRATEAPTDDLAV
jgi:trk system potassium uptake protein TrkH